jgi:hypothetical protein
MKRREVAYLLIGLGAGIIFAVAPITWWFHHMFIIGIKWSPASIVLTFPFLLVLIGSILLHRSNPERQSN